MEDKIKSFFKKNKANLKFMNAGKGYKLSDSTSSAPSNASAKHKEPIKRAEPTEEAKLAGQAALARLEAKKTDITKFGTSYAAIQARVRRELEQERKAQEAEKKDNTEPSKNAKDVIEDPALLAVSGVYFRCPHLSDEILSRDEWKKKIKEFLYDDLKGEDAGLTACLIIQNCNNGREKIDTCVETLGKYLENIINNPDVEKYRKIRMSNRIFQEKVLPILGALEFLNSAGFEQKKLLNNDVEEDFLIWSPENCGIEDLTVLVEALKSAEPIPLELDRNLQVLLPLQASEKNELPASFFAISVEEIKREHQLRSEAVERNQMLRTKAMREKDEQRELRKYKFSLIRVKFPDNIILQGTFSVHDKFRSVVDFVTENLSNSELPFVLKALTGQAYSDEYFDKTLVELRLIPTFLLIFAWKNNTQEKTNSSDGYLKPEILCYVQTE